MKTVIIIQLIFVITTIMMGVWNYELENYKTAMFLMFVAGVCSMKFLSYII